MWEPEAPPELHWGHSSVLAPTHPHGNAQWVYTILPGKGEGTVVLDARRVIRKGRSSLWLINLIFLSDLQQCQLEGAALTDPGVPASDPGWIRTLGHQGTAAQHVPGGTGAGWCPFDALAVGLAPLLQARPMATLSPGLGSSGQPCSPQGAPGEGHRCHRAQGTPQSRICVTCARRWPHTSPPRQSLTCKAGASPTPPWRLRDCGRAQMGRWHSQMAALDPNTSCMSPVDEPCTRLASAGHGAAPGSIQARHNGLVPREC